MFSVLDMFTIGVGPSSSHTVGPMVAAHAFVASMRDAGLVERTDRVRVTLYGSLSLTGLGHGTDRAVMAGLEGNVPATVDTQHMLRIRETCALDDTLNLAGVRRIGFDYDRDMVFDKWRRMAAHPNGMRFQAFDADGNLVDEQVWYSIGGGFIRRGAPDDLMIGIHERPPEGSSFADEDGGDSGTDFGPEAPYPFSSGSELVALCREHHLSIAELVWANETATRSAVQVRTDIDKVWRVMRECVDHGCTSTETVLPGGLDVPRRAPRMYERLASNSDVLKRGRSRRDAVLESSDAAWVNLFALAVSEENAGGGRIVTAPTNGSAGIIPAVLHYYWHFMDDANEEGVVTFLLTAGAIGYLFKRNASISGAEVGCQGEVGSACSMAAAGLAAVLGGTPEQVENAAEIGIEHNLGLTCDPVGGLVQIPCIERNAMAANTAINAVRMAMLGDGSHIVTLDQAIETMRETGEDMMAKYKETSKGGLAVNVVEC
ncbi:L-serine ammonia-lyase [Bifidobacterium sp. MA2]|uniref:L-serine ammonia-lyase n=1 Tax=Bifidobacterium santillanense TaxID=2809028 RepID=A0ABS5UQ18_9BIFI|nr:L-serine ammonia-lyase [Bifidobacterium santillanense]MBT1172961.1 L-serine ammonia-lyase [Bifidobacterium santillanense]